MKFEINISDRSMRWVVFILCTIILSVGIGINILDIVNGGGWGDYILIALYIETLILIASTTWPKQWNKFIVWISQPIWKWKHRKE
jgi:hypothetical protein